MGSKCNSRSVYMDTTNPRTKPHKRWVCVGRLDININYAEN